MRSMSNKEIRNSKCELTSVLAVIYSCFSNHCLTSYMFKTCLTSYENRSETGLIRLQVSDVSFKSYTGYK